MEKAFSLQFKNHRFVLQFKRLIFVYEADFVLFIQNKKQILEIFFIVNHKLSCIRSENDFNDHLFDIFVLIIFFDRNN